MRLYAFLANQVNKVVRKVPNFITDKVTPFLMPKAYLEKSRTNSVGIVANWTNQARCAKYCATCPSNPLTHGGLYCISGKSTRDVEEKGCNCFECDLFEKCGGGVGYFCKYGNVDEMKESLNISLTPISKNNEQTSRNPLSSPYEDRFISELFSKTPPQSKTPTNQTTSLTSDFQLNFTDQKSQSDKNLISIQASSKNTILTSALKKGVEINHICGGNAKCSTCRVLVIEGLNNLLPRNKKEDALAIKKKMPPNIRLACQTQATNNIKIKRLTSNPETINNAIQEGTTTKSLLSIEKEIVVFFSDIRGFTTFSEKNYTYDTVFILNKYFEMVGKILDKYNGYIDKYMGDGIMVLFGLTHDNKYTPAEAAIRASLEIVSELKIFNQNLKKEFNHEFAIGIGLHKGNLVLSNLGYNKKKQFTAIGDTVNTSARIESETKNKKTPLLISDSIYESIKHIPIATWREEESILLKGKITKTKLYSFITDSVQQTNEQKTKRLKSNQKKDLPLGSLKLEELINHDETSKLDKLIQFKKKEIVK